jgi:hypothetical protein
MIYFNIFQHHFDYMVLSKLLRASVVSDLQGYRRVRSSFALKDSDLPGHLALFAVDFAINTCRRITSPFAAPCGLAGAFQGRCLAGPPSDTADRQSIHADLAAVGLALRPRPAPPAPARPGITPHYFLYYTALLRPVAPGSIGLYPDHQWMASFMGPDHTRAPHPMPHPALRPVPRPLLSNPGSRPHCHVMPCARPRLGRLSSGPI